jgi:hypothetical protein
MTKLVLPHLDSLEQQVYTALGANDRFAREIVTITGWQFLPGR